MEELKSCKKAAETIRTLAGSLIRRVGLGALKYFNRNFQLGCN